MGLLRNYSNAVIKRVTSFLLIVSVLASIFICGGNCYISAAQDLKTTAITDNTINYADYLSNYTEASKPDETGGYRHRRKNHRKQRIGRALP